MKFEPQGIKTQRLLVPSVLRDFLVNTSELSLIIGSEYLHEKKSFFIVESDGSYRDDGLMFTGLIPARINLLLESLAKGKTILIKNLEHWNQSIRMAGDSLGSYVDVHMYISPGRGTAFDWHSDDRDVSIYLLKGRKRFIVREFSGEERTYDLSSGQGLFIPYGVMHKAEPSEDLSIHLSFGLWPNSITIRDTYMSYPTTIDIL